MDTVKLNQIKNIRTALKGFAGRDRRAMLRLKRELRDFEVAVMDEDTIMADLCESGVDYWFHQLVQAPVK